MYGKEQVFTFSPKILVVTTLFCKQIQSMNNKPLKLYMKISQYLIKTKHLLNNDKKKQPRNTWI